MPSSTGSDADKTSLRQHYLIVRRASSPHVLTQIDKKIYEQVLKLEAYQKASLVLTYVSFGHEVDTRRVIKKSLELGKQVAIPKCSRHQLDFYLIDSLTDLIPGYMGILEPQADPERKVSPAMQKGSVCLVPGLVFDGQGYRIGYGGGYYDRFLAFYMGEKIGLTRSLSVSSNPLPREKHDVRVDILGTEAGSFRVTLC